MDLSIAILGASGIASSHVASFRKIDGIDIPVVYSRSESRARDFAAKNCIPAATADLAQALQNVDAVLIATEPTRHADLALRVMDFGKHILLEKPLDVDFEAAERLARRAAEYDRVVSVVSQKRFDPLLQRMEEDFRKLAAPAMVDLKVFWRRTNEYYAHGSGWRRSESDFFVNQGIHWLDVMNWFLGAPCEIHSFASAARSGIVCTDRAAAILRYRDGSLASVSGGSFVTHSAPDTFTIRCSEGTLDHHTLSQDAAHGRERSRFLRGAVESPNPSLLDEQARDFVEAIREGRAATTTVDQALSALRVALAISNRMDLHAGDRQPVPERS